jgi:hypothetical protein
MRKILSGIAIFAAVVLPILIVWICDGQRLSLFLDRFGTIESTSTSIRTIQYQGNGTDGILRVNDLQLSLTSVDPQVESLSVGTTKDGELALALSGRVFALGKIESGQREEQEDLLATSTPPGDEAVVRTWHSAISWPNPFELRLMTNHSTVWNRYDYYQLLWRKPNGAKLEMLWRNGPNFYCEGWTISITTHGEITGLIRVDISNTAR